MMKKIIHHIIKLNASYRFLIAISIALLVLLFLPSSFSLATRVIITTNTFTFATSLLIWLVIVNVNKDNLKHIAAKEDSSVSLIFGLVVFLALGSLITIIILLGSVKGLNNARLTEHIIFSMISVAGSWVLVHSVYTLHYARLYFSEIKSQTNLEQSRFLSNLKNVSDEEKGKELFARQSKFGGVDFPGTDKPDYLDFAYFSFVIGMTSQVSDVQVTSSKMRREVLMHGILSFIFNTIIVAMSINIVAGLLQR